LTVPLPVPDSPPVTRIQTALVLAFHAQPAPVATATEPVPAALPTEVPVGVSVAAHGLLNANWFESPLRAVPAGPTAATRAS
jgi:hypothetical protein